MNKIDVTPRGPWADVRSCMSQVQSITIVVNGQVYTDFTLTESAGQVTLVLRDSEARAVEEAFKPEPWTGAPKRRGRPPKTPADNAHPEGDDAQ